MKVYIHAYSEQMFVWDAYIEVEMSAQPLRGDSVWLSEYHQLDLEQQIIDLRHSDSVNCHAYDSRFDSDDAVSLEGFGLVVEAVWIPTGNYWDPTGGLNYEYHIALSDEELSE